MNVLDSFKTTGLLWQSRRNVGEGGGKRDRGFERSATLKDEFTTIASQIHKERLSWSREKRRSNQAMKRELSSMYLLEVQRMELERLRHEYDAWEEAMDALERDLDTLEENIDNAMGVLHDQVNTVLHGKKDQCEQACERINDLYVSVAESRDETITRIPEMIKSNIDVVMGRVLETALAKSGGIHSELDLLFAKTQKSGSIYKLVINSMVTLNRKYVARAKSPNSRTQPPQNHGEGSRFQLPRISLKWAILVASFAVFFILVGLVVNPE